MHHVQVCKEKNDVFAYEIMSKMAHVWREEGKADWAYLGADGQEVWEMQRQQKIARQPLIRDQIIASLRQNLTKSFEKVAADIDNWCCASSIMKWMHSHSSYCMYVERLLPLLSTPQRAKHVYFAKHLRRNWGLPIGRYLWIHYDEKWFWGFVARTTAKACDQLGLTREQHFIYHTSHINKVMCIAITGYAFKNLMENGGDSLKLGFHRCEAAKIVKRQVRACRTTEDGKRRFNGQVIREKGETYMVDCNVTGADDGTSDNPKFALLSLFCDGLFPKIQALVGPAGEYEGYTLVIQGDNTGPHQEATFVDWCTNFCGSSGWLPQAPQMPHANNLDRAVFPAMSKSHSALLRAYSGSVAPEDEIWKAAEATWNRLDSGVIARGMILAYRVAAKVIKHAGSNTFLGDGGLHCDVRNDFTPTPTGIKPKIIVLDN